VPATFAVFKTVDFRHRKCLLQFVIISLESLNPSTNPQHPEIFFSVIIKGNKYFFSELVLQTQTCFFLTTND